MKIALCGEGTERHRVLLDLAIPDYVKYALDVVGGLTMKDRPDLYAAELPGGHGSAGFVFSKGDEYLCRKELFRRVSISSPSYDENDPEKQLYFDPAHPTTLHISVRGERNFSPKEWDGNPATNPTNEHRKYLIGGQSEEINVSLRWGSTGLETNWNALARNFCVDGRRTFIGQARTHGYTGQAPDHDEPLREGTVRWAEEPFDGRIKGYEGVFGVLAKHGLEVVTEEQLKMMTKEEGIDFLFKKVAPAVERFIVS